MRTGNILWPTDFSDTASHALQYAIEMANLYQVGIRILHIVDQGEFISSRHSYFTHC